MGFLQNRRIRKAAAVVAFVSALATACASKSEQFAKLVSKKDKAVAAALIEDSSKKKDWENVLADLNYLNNSVQRAKDNEERSKLVPFGGLDGLIILSTGTTTYLQQFSTSQFRTRFRWSLRNLRAVGLVETAAELERRLLDLDLAHDKTLANRIGELTGQFLQYSTERQKRDLEGYRHWEKALRDFQQAARKAGFNKTADACGDALINIRATIAK